jgi:hypothetical protein
MLARPITSLRSLPARVSSLHSANCSLLTLFFGSSPFRISNLQPLFAKHPGWGNPSPCALTSACLPSSLLLITYMQAPHFHAITHSFARRESSIHPVFNSFRTLSIAIGRYPHLSFSAPSLREKSALLEISGRATPAVGAPPGWRRCDGQWPRWKSRDSLPKRSETRSRP